MHPSRGLSATDTTAEDLKSETSIETLAQRASDALDLFPPNCELAVNCYLRAIEIDSTNISILDSFGELLANIGDSDRAIEVLTRSAQLAPNSGALKYFYLGQMMNGKDSLMSYKKCVEIMLVDASDCSPVEQDEIRERLISIYCLIGELYMTDLSDEIEAEDECFNAFNSALNIDGSSVEALNGIATFHRMRLEIEESKKFSRTAFEIVDSVPPEEREDTIPFPIRMRLAENLVELEMIEEALEILASLLDEDEEDLQSWFLTGCCHLIAKEKEEAVECVKQAKRLIKKNRPLIDAIVVEHWVKNFSELENRIRTV